MLSAIVSNCVNPFKKDVFQFPGFPPPIGPLPALPLSDVPFTRVLALNILFSNNKYPEKKKMYTYTHIRARERDSREFAPPPQPLYSGQFSKLSE